MKILVIHKRDCYFGYKWLIGRKVAKWEKNKMTIKGYYSGDVTLVSPVRMCCESYKKIYFYAVKIGE